VIPYSPVALARDLRAIAGRLENAVRVEDVVKCHDEIITLLIQMSGTEASMVGK